MLMKFCIGIAIGRCSKIRLWNTHLPKTKFSSTHKQTNFIYLSSSQIRTLPLSCIMLLPRFFSHLNWIIILFKQGVCIIYFLEMWKVLKQHVNIVEVSLKYQPDLSFHFQAVSRRATLHEMIRDYDQAASDLQRLISILVKQSDKTKTPEASADRASSRKELKQARQRLSVMEEKSKEGIPLDFFLIMYANFFHSQLYNSCYWRRGYN